MRRRQALAVVLGLVVTTFGTVTPAAADDKETLVERIVGKADPELLEVLVTTRGEGGAPRFQTIKVPDVAAAKRVVGSKLGRSGVLAVEMNRRVSTGANDPLFRNQWALDSRHFYFDRVNSVTRNDQSRPYVAVVDSGVQSGHTDLAGRVGTGYDAFGGGSTADACGHGTHVAGIIAATANNYRGVAGLAPRAYIRPVKVLRWEGGLLGGGDCVGYSSTVAAGITWAADHAHIINLSIEALSPSDAERIAVNYARSRGRAVIAAAGNSGDGVVVYPAGYSGVIGVGAVARSNSYPYWTQAGFSNPGSWVDVAAPGVDIVSTVPPSNRTCSEYPSAGSGYCFLSGTSMATPYVAATVALGVQHCRWSTSTALVAMQRTASHYPKKFSKVGYGVVNPLRVLQC
ncbi:MAG TPA: S8 family serine peptidase [Aeromicrobium sp.]|nr:S8 family serine peptidase [Aeromicrobium sp.]